MIPSGVRIYVALDPVDMRLSFNRLAGIVPERVDYDARSGALFLFLGRRRDALKILFFDGSGMVLFCNSPKLPHDVGACRDHPVFGAGHRRRRTANAHRSAPVRVTDIKPTRVRDYLTNEAKMFYDTSNMLPLLKTETSGYLRLSHPFFRTLRGENKRHLQTRAARELAHQMIGQSMPAIQRVVNAPSPTPAPNTCVEPHEAMSDEGSKPRVHPHSILATALAMQTCRVGESCCCHRVPLHVVVHGRRGPSHRRSFLCLEVLELPDGPAHTSPRSVGSNRGAHAAGRYHVRPRTTRHLARQPRTAGSAKRLSNRRLRQQGLGSLRIPCESQVSRLAVRLGDGPSMTTRGRRAMPTPVAPAFEPTAMLKNQRRRRRDQRCQPRCLGRQLRDPRWRNLRPKVLSEMSRVTPPMSRMTRRIALEYRGARLRRPTAHQAAGKNRVRARASAGCGKSARPDLLWGALEGQRAGAIGPSCGRKWILQATGSRTWPRKRRAG